MNWSKSSTSRLVISSFEGIAKRYDSRTNRDPTGKGAVLELVVDRLSQSLLDLVGENVTSFHKGQYIAVDSG
jgi:hypothetical protein